MYAQENSWVQMMQDPNANFYDIQKAFNAEWKDKVPGKGQGYKQFKRWENFMAPRVYPTGKLPHDIIATELIKVVNDNNLKSRGQAQVANWVPLGPTNVPTNGLSYASAGIGRVNCVRFDPANNNNIWIGTPGGGLWKSTNGGTTWTTNTDAFSTLGIADIAIDPTNSNIMYIATGDADGGDTYSIGILKSIDGGATWNTTGLTYVTSSYRKVTRLLINPTDPTIIIAATNLGVYRSTNSGTSFTAVITSGTFYDLEFKPGDPTVVYAASYSGSGTGKIYYSTNSGTSFSVATGIPTTDVLRVSLAVSPASPTTVYALIAKASDYGYKGLYKSTNSGASYTLVHSTPNILSGDETAASTGGQGWYDLTLAVSPLDANLIYVGGVNVWKSTNGGSSFTITGHWYAGSSGTLPFIHADQHYLEFMPNSSTIISCNDGGIRKSTNNGASWTDLSNGLQIMQFYRISGSVQNAGIVYGGAQDNGTNRKIGTAWNSAYGGDGMKCIVDPTNSNIVYASTQYGGIVKSTNGGTSFGNIKPAAAPNGDWITPYALDPNSTSTIYAGYDEIYKSTNSGSSWTTVTGNLSSGVVYSHLAIAPSNGNYVYAATSTKLFKTINAGTSWTNITVGLPVSSATISNIAIASDDPNKVYVTFSGYSASNKIFMTTNGGTSWTNISTGLPNLPVNCVALQNGSDAGIYVGTDVGVYYKNNSVAWTAFMTNLPNVSVRDLEIHYGSGKIRAATFGRGLWESDLYNSVVALAPVAEFSANNTTIVAGQSVTFTDLSVNTPTSWKWTFTGGTPSSSTLQNPSVVYSTPGVYSVKLKSTNSVGSDSTTKTSYITVTTPGAVSCKSWDTYASGFTTASRGIESFEVVNQNVVWAIAYDGSGGGATIRDYTKTTNGGLTWTPGTITASGLTTSYGLANISSIHQDTAWAAVYPVTATITAQGIYYTTNGGTTWTRQASAAFSTSTSFANFVHFFNKNDGVAMGDPASNYFEIYTTSNAGTTWTRVPSSNIPAPLATDEYGTVGYFTAVGNTIWFLSTKGRIFKSTNKGLNWTAASTPLGTSASISNIAFKDQLNGLITVNDATTQGDLGIYSTSDGGATWTALTTSTAGITNKSGIAFVPGTTGTYFISGATTNGSGTAYSTDNGATWTSIDAIQHTAIDFYNESYGWSGGFNTSNTVGGIFKIATSTIVANINTPVSTSFCANDSLILTANSGGNYSYQWYLGGSPISGATNVSYAAKQAGMYTVEVTEGTCSTLSSAVTLTTNPAPAKPTITGVLSFCSGDSTLLASSYAVSYQWYKNNIAIPNATNQMLTVNSSGNYYVRISDSSSCTTNSDAVAVQSIAMPAKPVITYTGDNQICDGESLLLTSSANSNNAWYKNGILIPGATLPFIDVTEAGTYVVVVSTSNGLCKISSDSIIVIVNPLPAKPTITKDSLTLTSSAANAYQWFKNETIIVNATTQTYTVTESGDYKVRIKDLSDCEAFSDVMNVQVTGLENSYNNTIHVYPNPVKDILTVSGIGNRVSGKVMNYLGEMVLEVNSPDGLIDVSSLPHGFYILKTDNGVARFIKQ